MEVRSCVETKINDQKGLLGIQSGLAKCHFPGNQSRRRILQKGLQGHQEYLISLLVVLQSVLQELLKKHSSHGDAARAQLMRFARLVSVLPNAGSLEKPGRYWVLFVHLVDQSLRGHHDVVATGCIPNQPCFSCLKSKVSQVSPRLVVDVAVGL